MELNLFRTNVLAIIGSGIAVSLIRIILFSLKGHVSAYMHYLLTIPPMGAAAYIFNLFIKYDGELLILLP